MQDPAERSRFRRRLLAWFDRQQRDLPWRKQRTRYRIWVSEIMLQQTQVVTVIDYFQRFVTRFPSVRHLAAAEESEVLKLWEGLGYYRRARQMHAAAGLIMSRHAGRFPDTLDEVLALPGIGRYTASAILSIADDQPLPVLEGNTLRVYSRLLNWQEDVTRSASQRHLWDFAASLVSRHRPGDLNQALMELGSEVCVTGQPRCLLCPVARHCVAFREGQPERLPHKGNSGLRYEDLHQAAVVIGRNGRFVMRLCGPGEHWTGLWDFPRYTLNGEDAVSQITGQVHRQTGLSVNLDSPYQQLRHAVTRFRIRLDCYHARQIRGRLRSSDSLRWVPAEELASLAMSVTGRQIARTLSDDRRAPP
jgi:A/G-specific adenine glycosylase